MWVRILMMIVAATVTCHSSAAGDVARALTAAPLPHLIIMLIDVRNYPVSLFAPFFETYPPQLYP